MAAPRQTIGQRCSTPRAKQLLVVATATAIILVVVLTVSTSGRSSEALPIVFISYTNGAQPERTAIFTVTNVQSRQIGYSVVPEIKDGSGWRYYGIGARTGAAAVLPPHKWPPQFSVAPGQASTFTVAVPTHASTWRVSLMYQKAPRMCDDIGLAISQFFYRLGMSAVVNRVPTAYTSYTVYSPERTD